MPELPEVETVKKTLNKIILGKTIKDVTVYWENIIQYPKEVEAFSAELIDQTIYEVGRKGKFLIFNLDHHVLISHLRMEGKYAVHQQHDEIEPHTHVIFHFTDGSELRYKDVRKFGTMHLYEKGREFSLPPLNKLGPEPFEERFSPEYLHDRFQKTTRVIKNVLLDQSVVTGLGNIYVDEALFRSGIHPLRPARQLTRRECEKLATEIVQTLQDAIDAGGTTIRSYLNSLGEIGMFQLQLFVYGRKGEECKKCQSLIEKIKVGGRGTHLCPHCQKLH
ncbi:DNA-formamidopyrimidine glycosylase [Salinibacillus xinjiangensis]|uniref:Formamidopyrimidine-DNA glycosylase n=1 Tax=Salinibacillus xinjiangensis TaxID=1229268 RepID=A0A6G1X9X0_9BACI|nr:DNA-formamidopyrimidine glycosylase [Salinibacillus xinjiangensis]MRG87670.1 DNA-formamidopyrimidine glycosylase [Salinibacillus xinjiangensis]